ncbi:hypothetical protein C0993_002357 [Termitomyces sp. T159_Od127]|nr:hypothetical protein C0993_002357 [Termitomyces sp. T159_Od127]
MVYVKRTDDDDDDDDDPIWWRKITKHLNFFRVHVMYYIFTPLIFSAIFYASNGRYHIPYIDALFNCVSAMTVCGLTTVNLSMLTGWQQTILFLLMCLGNPVLVSWVVVLQRRHYFAIKFNHVLKANAEKHAEEIAQSGRKSSWSHRVSTLLSKKHDVAEVEEKNKKKGIIHRLRPDMIRRMDDAPKRVNPSGYAVSSEKAPALQNVKPGHLSFVPSIIHESDHSTARRNSVDPEEEDKRRSHPLLDPGARSSLLADSTKPVCVGPSIQLTYSVANFPPTDTVQQQQITQSSDLPQTFPRTQTIEFAPNVARRRARMTADMTESDIADNVTTGLAQEQTPPDYGEFFCCYIDMH